MIMKEKTTYCCENCFTDKILKQQIKFHGVKGSCDFCGAIRVCAYPIVPDKQQLQDELRGIIDLYEPAADKGVPLTEALIEDWDFVSHDLQSHLGELLHALYPQPDNLMAALLSGNVKRKDFGELAILGGHSWSEFSEHVKRGNRYHIDYFQRKALDTFLSAVCVSVSPKESLYRARICHNGSGFAPKDMGAPPGLLARAGRINPAGISELYLADSEDTALHEVRAGMFDIVTFGRFQPQEQLTVADLSAFSRISPFADAISTESVAVNHEVLREMTAEMAKQMRSNDDPIEYVPTQFIAEYAKTVDGIDGVRYDSTLVKGGVNYCFFNPNRLRCFEVRTTSIQGLSYVYKSQVKDPRQNTM